MTSDSLQLVVTNENLLQAITFNYEQLKTALSKYLEQYSMSFITDTDLVSAKKDRAMLNKLEGTLKLRQQEIEKTILGDFMLKIKELRAMVASASKGIDEQIKYYEQQIKDKKKYDIEEIYKKYIGDLESVVSFEKLFDDSWLNKTYKIATIEADLKTSINIIRTNLSVIDQLGGGERFNVAVRSCYLRTLDLSEAMAERARLECEYGCSKNFEDDIECKVEPGENGPIQKIDFRVWGSHPELIRLRNFMKSSGLAFQEI